MRDEHMPSAIDDAIDDLTGEILTRTDMWLKRNQEFLTVEKDAHLHLPWLTPKLAMMAVTKATETVSAQVSMEVLVRNV